MASKPDVFRYHDYRELLKDWLGFLKATKPGFSLRALAREAGFAVGYLPTVLGGGRPISSKALLKLIPLLGLNRTERSYLEALVAFGTSKSQAVRMDALERMKRFQSYRSSNPKEIEVHQYLTHWYYVAIREMAALPGFRLDPEWIQEQLREPVPLQELRDALEFLEKSGFIARREDGSIHLPERNLECTGGVYRVALSQFHRELLALASRSIENAQSSERLILGHTLATDAKVFEQACAILNDAIARIRALQPKESDGGGVYHLELAFFPLTQQGGVKR